MLEQNAEKTTYIEVCPICNEGPFEESIKCIQCIYSLCLECHRKSKNKCPYCRTIQSVPQENLDRVDLYNLVRRLLQLETWTNDDTSGRIPYPEPEIPEYTSQEDIADMVAQFNFIQEIIHFELATIDQIIDEIHPTFVYTEITSPTGHGEWRWGE